MTSDSDARSLAGAPPTRRAGQSAGVPPMVAIFLITVVLIPVELGFFVGPLFFTWSKAFVMIVAIPVMVRAVSELKLVLPDILFITHTVWTGICTVLNKGGGGIEGAGTYFLEFAVVYLLIRLEMRSLAQFQAVVRMLFWLVAACALMAIPEAMLKVRFIHEVASALTGLTYHFSEEERWGFLRAASFFEHPILHGLFCASLFSLMWFAEPGAAARLGKTVVITIGTFFALSSAPLLVLVAQMGLAMTERATRWLPARLMVITLGIVGLIAFLNVATGRGAFGILASLTINPQTAWYRTAIWENGLDDIWRSPIIGIVPESWTRLFWMSSSIDNHWLLMAFMSGLPGLFLFFACIFAIWRRLTKGAGENRPPAYRQLSLGWGIMIVALILGGATVAYFGRMQPLLAFFVSFGAALACNRETLQSEVTETVRMPVSSRPRRRTVL